MPRSHSSFARSMLEGTRGGCPCPRGPLDRRHDLRSEVDATTATPPYKLSYNELPQDMKKHIDGAYDRMVEDSMKRQSAVDAANASKARRGETQ
jgi:hypothetical protein